MAGVLGSLVSITAICGVVRPGESLAIGFVGAAIAIFGWQLLNKIRIDDPVGAVSTHAGGSIWGMIAVGLFVEKDSLERPFSSTYGAFKGGHVRILGVQLLACVAITAWTLVTVFIQLYAIDKSVGLRLPLEEEILGADACEHGIDQSQANTKCHLKPVPTSQNRVFPEQTSEGHENAGTNTNDNCSQFANEQYHGNRIDESELLDYQESDAALTSDDASQDNKVDVQKQLQSVQENGVEDNGNTNISAKGKWGKILTFKRNLDTGRNTASEEQRHAKGSLSQHKRKAPVIITLTPADDDRAFRLSVSDLHKLKE